MRKIILFLFIFLIFGLFDVAAQDRPLILLWPMSANPTEAQAVEIIEARTAGKVIEAGRPFTAENDWLQSFTVKVRNVSGKPIRSINLTFTILGSSTESGAGLGFSFIFGRSCGVKTSRPCQDREDDSRFLKPGAETDMKFNFGNYTRIKAKAPQVIGTTEFNRVRINLAVVQFEDETIVISQNLAPVPKKAVR